MKTSIILIQALALSAVIFSCSAQPEPFKYGTDVCYVCKMGIADVKFGTELVTKKGKIYKFDDIGCMVRYLKSGALEQKDVSQTVAINYEEKDDFLDVTKSAFAVSDEIRSPMNFNTAAFSSKEAAQKFLAGKKGNILSWNEIYNRIE